MARSQSVLTVIQATEKDSGNLSGIWLGSLAVPLPPTQSASFYEGQTLFALPFITMHLVYNTLCYFSTLCRR